MARPAHPLVWHQLRFALPLPTDTAVGLVERILADGSLGRVVLELRASGGQATWALGSSAGERLARVVRELAPGCRVSRGFSRRAVDQAVVVSARPVGTGLATERLSAVVRAVLAALAVTAEDEELVVQLQLGRRFSPQTLGRVEPQGWLELLGLVPPPSLSGERGRRMRAQVGRHRAAASLRLGVRAASPLRQRVLLQGLLGALRLVEGPGVRLRARTEHPAKLDGGRAWSLVPEKLWRWRVGRWVRGRCRRRRRLIRGCWRCQRRVRRSGRLPREWQINLVSALVSRLVMRSTTRCCWGRRGLVSPPPWPIWRWRTFTRVGVCC